MNGVTDTKLDQDNALSISSLTMIKPNSNEQPTMALRLISLQPSLVQPFLISLLGSATEYPSTVDEDAGDESSGDESSGSCKRKSYFFLHDCARLMAAK